MSREGKQTNVGPDSFAGLAKAIMQGKSEHPEDLLKAEIKELPLDQVMERVSDLQVGISTNQRHLSIVIDEIWRRANRAESKEDAKSGDVSK